MRGFARPKDITLSQVENFPRVKDPRRVKLILDPAHQFYGMRTVFAAKQILVSQTDTVFTGDSAFQRQRSFDYLIIHRHSLLPLVFILPIGKDQRMKQPQPDMPKSMDKQAMLLPELVTESNHLG